MENALEHKHIEVLSIRQRGNDKVDNGKTLETSQESGVLCRVWKRRNSKKRGKAQKGQLRKCEGTSTKPLPKLWFRMHAHERTGTNTEWFFKMNCSKRTSAMQVFATEKQP